MFGPKVASEATVAHEHRRTYYILVVHRVVIIDGNTCCHLHLSYSNFKRTSIITSCSTKQIMLHAKPPKPVTGYKTKMEMLLTLEKALQLPIARGTSLKPG